MTDLTVVLRLKADGSGFVGEVRRAGDAVGRLGDTARATGQQAAPLERALAGAAVGARQAAAAVQATDRALQDGETAATAYQRRVEQMRTAVSDYGPAAAAAQAATRQVGATMGGAAIGIGEAAAALRGFVAILAGNQALQAAGGIARIGDEMRSMQARLANVLGSQAAAADAFERLAAGASRAGLSLTGASQSFLRFSRAAEQMGTGRAEVLAFTDAVGRLGMVGGSSTQETAAAMQQLGQALASGRLQGDELRAIMENMPALTQAIASGLGVGLGQLRAMGEAGELTSRRVFGAILAQQEKIASEFARMPDTMARAAERARNEFDLLAASVDRASGLGNAFAQALNNAARTMANLGRALAPTAADRLREAEAAIAHMTALGTSVMLTADGTFMTRAAAIEQRQRALNDLVARERREAGAYVDEQARLRSAQIAAAAARVGQLDEVGKAARETQTDIEQVTGAIALLEQEIADLGATDERARILATLSAGLALLRQELAAVDSPLGRLRQQIEDMEAVSGLAGGSRRRRLKAIQDARVPDLGGVAAEDYEIEQSRIDTAEAQAAIRDLAPQVAAARALAAAAAQSAAALREAEVQAKAFQFAFDRGLDGNAAIVQGYAAALREIDRAARSQQAALWAQGLEQAAAATDQLAAAQDRGATAVAAAERANRIDAETLRLGEESRQRVIAAIDREISSRKALTLATARAGLDRQITDAGRLADAVARGAAAEREAAVAIQVRNKLDELRIEAGSAEARQIEARIRLLDEETRRRDNAGVLRNLQEQLDLGAEEARLVGWSTRERRIQEAILQKQLELKRRGIDLTGEQATAELALTRQLAEQNAAREVAERQAENVQRVWSNAGDNIQDALAEAFEAGLDDIGRKNASAAEIFRRVWTRTISQVGTAMAIRPFVGGVLQAVGAPARVLESYGVTPTAGAGGGIFSLAGLTSAFKPASWGSDIVQSGVGEALGLSTFVGEGIDGGFVATSLGSSIATGLNYAGYGAIGSIGASLFGLGGGIGGTIGGTLGSVGGSILGAQLLGASLGGPVGAIAGGFLGTALGGLFGGRKPSNTGSGATVFLDTGRLGGFEDKGGNGAARDDVGRGIQDARRALQRATGGALAGRVSYYVGSRDGYQADVFGGDGQHLGPTVRAAEAADFIGQVTLKMAQTLEGASDIVMTAIRNTTDAADLIANIQFARTFDATVQAFSGGLTAIEEQRLALAAAARQEASAASDRIAAFRDKAAELFSERTITGYETQSRQVTDLRNLGGVGQDNADWREVTETVTEQVPVYQDLSQRARDAAAAVKDLALSQLGLVRAGEAYVAAEPADALAGTALAVETLHQRIEAWREVLTEAGFTVAETSAIIATAQVEGMRQLREDYLDQVERSLLSPAAADWSAVSDAVAEAVYTRDNLGFSAAEKTRIDALIGETVGNYVKGLDLRGLRDLEDHLHSLDAAAPGAAAGLAAVAREIARAKTAVLQDLDVRELAALGREEEAADLRRRLDAEREYQAAIDAGYDDAMLARLAEIQALERAAAAQARVNQEADAAASAFERLGDRLRHAADGLATDTALSPYSSSEKLAITRRRYEETLAAARGGDREAADALPELGRAYLAALRAFEGNEAVFRTEFGAVEAALRDLASDFDVQARHQRALVSLAQDQVAGLHDTVGRLDQLIALCAVRPLAPAPAQWAGLTAAPNAYGGAVNAGGRALDEEVDIGDGLRLKRGTFHELLARYTGQRPDGSGSFAAWQGANPAAYEAAMASIREFARQYPGYDTGGAVRDGAIARIHAGEWLYTGPAAHVLGAGATRSLLGRSAEGGAGEWIAAALDRQAKILVDAAGHLAEIVTGAAAQLAALLRIEDETRAMRREAAQMNALLRSTVMRA